jgi:hypothetical protein
MTHSNNEPISHLDIYKQKALNPSKAKFKYFFSLPIDLMMKDTSPLIVSRQSTAYKSVKLPTILTEFQNTNDLRLKTKNFLNSKA